MIRRGANPIAFVSCISKGTPIDFACSFAKEMREAVKNATEVYSHVDTDNKYSKDNVAKLTFEKQVS